MKLFILTILVMACLSSRAVSQGFDFSQAKEDRYSDLHEVPNNVFWGDTHVHTNLSLDAFIYGNRSLGPEAAYQFARGKTVTTDNGHLAKLARPLDFIVVADHALDMGAITETLKDNPLIIGKKRTRQWKSMLQKIIGQEDESYKLSRHIFMDSLKHGPLGDLDFSSSVFYSSAKIADKHNTPGQFTAFVGYEWTPPFNLHRVVVFDGNAESVKGLSPLSAYDRADPEQLWGFMAGYENDYGHQVLAIPHNPNRSSGVMFAPETAQGEPLSRNYSITRSRWEPLVEVTQIKGDSETHPYLSPDDEFADFETLDNENAPLSVLKMIREQWKYSDYINWYDPRRANNRDSNWMRPYEYVRSGLKEGIKYHSKIGINPFKFGLVGGTDSHTSLATADENYFFGKVTTSEPSAERLGGPWSGVFKSTGAWSKGWKMNAAGYTGIWAEENTRESLFAAMKRKEVYATTGPRINLRFFGGWNYKKEDAFKPDLARIGYAHGVPMGGDLTVAPVDKAPCFLIRAVKDPEGANLDRVQVIKGWHDTEGNLHEKVHNVALSDNRKENWRGKVKPVGNTVDIANASYTNTIGDPELAVVWQDPDFNPNELAFYYVRVLEIPTPRWTAYDAKYFQLKDLPEEVPMVTQERAYSSPIWYSPGQQQ